MTIGLKTSMCVHDIDTITFQKMHRQKSDGCRTAHLEIYDSDGNHFSFSLFGEAEFDLEILPEETFEESKKIPLFI